jgi:lipid-A-disaccharide synthase
MLAGEASGDNLGAALVRQLKVLAPDTRFVGIGGPAMEAEGFQTDIDIERLSVNGIVEPLKRLPELIRILYQMRDRVLDSGADCFIGIDFNFFNVMLAGMLKRRGVRTVQYVSPTVWAWRKGRIHKIRRNIDLMLTLYPFETRIYQAHQIPVAFVGHPKADEIEPQAGIDGRAAARELLGIGEGERVVAMLPGSRGSEVALTGADFLATARNLKGSVDRFLIPAANEKRREQLKGMLAENPELGASVQLLHGQSREAMTAADVVLVNSGTATLEAMLLKKPMVMSYRLGPLTYAIVSRMIDMPWFALPNILAGKRLVAEMIQDDADPAAMAREVRVLLEADNVEAMLLEYEAIHQSLRKGAAPGHAAAVAVLEFLGRKADV